MGLLLGSLRSIHFDVLGFNRTFWDFFVAAGFSVGLLYLFAALLASRAVADRPSLGDGYLLAAIPARFPPNER